MAEFNGTVWKLGTIWDTGKRNFYPLLKSLQVAIGVSDKLYQPGDIIGFFDGFRLIGIAEVTQPAKPVTTQNDWEAQFEQYDLEFESWMMFTPVQIYDVAKEDELIYQERKGIVKIHIQDVRDKIITLIKKYKPQGPSLNQSLRLYRDAPAVIDQLGRKPFVKALRQYIDRLWSGSDLDAYTIHINGEWGSGKSTLLNLLKDDLEKEGTKGWIVVNFNAWQYQHIEVPWWVFLDNVYKTILKKETFPRSLYVYIREQAWRIFSINRNRWFTFCAFLAIALATLFSKSSFLTIGSLFSSTSSNNKAGIVVSVLSLIGTIAAFIYAIINSLLPGSEDAALNFKKNVRDPMQKIKEHYSSIIGYTEKHVAVFIDDIDRCNPEFVVALLEGLQTLFRTGRILYVIAGDASWIRESFEIHYGDLKKVITKQGQSLGNFFVEKTLQQSVNLPQVTRELKKTFWNSLLEGKEEKITEEQLANIDHLIEQATGDDAINQAIDSAGSDLEKTLLRQKAAEKMSSTTNLKNIEHSLLKYYDLLEPNPRSMKRLVNSLALEKAVNYLSGLSGQIDDDHLVRWSILKSRFPLVAVELKKDRQSFVVYSDETAYPEIAPLLKGLDAEQLYKLMPN